MTMKDHVIIWFLVGLLVGSIRYNGKSGAPFRKRVLWTICYAVGFATVRLGLLVVTHPVNKAQAAPQARSHAEVTQELFQQKQQKQTEINQLKTEITGLEVEVNQQYAQLTSRRKLLNTNAKADVEAFNTSAAVYTRNNQSLATKKNELDRLWKELDLLNAESDRLAREQAQAAPKVVVYSTSWCPACQEAKAYLRGKGIPFSDKNVETSQEAAEEFSRLGGRGVPLILINGQRSDGFSPQWIDQQLAQN